MKKQNNALVKKENQNTEWKESWRDEYLKWICAFANAEGGVLDIGRNDKGVVIGVPNAARLLEEIPNKVRDILGILVEVNLREEAGKEYLEIVTEPYPSPISYKGEYHIRSGSTKQELKGAALDRFLMRKQGLHWDGIPFPGYTAEDLSPQAFAFFRKRAARSQRLSEEMLAESNTVLLDKLKLVEKGYLKRAAVMLFHEDAERVVTGAFVKVGYFRTNTDLLYHDLIYGDLFTQVEKTLDLLLTKYLRAGISYEGIYRVETFPIPEAALREAVINAIAHKDYASCVPIQISVYHNKLMIWNPGQLPPHWTQEQFTGKHASEPHNPDIANAFFKADYLESWGRGIELIQNTCREHGSPEPLFRWDSGLWVEFPFNEVPGLGNGLGNATQAKSDSLNGTINGLINDTINGTINGTIKLSQLEQNLLILLSNQPTLTIPELVSQLKKSERTIKRSLKNLQINERLKRIGSRKTGHWEVLK